ncbi:iron chaperone [Streptomyces sp. NPDC002602]|uniref:iron chaperone n=1 Tax=Streptomyces sp. NPDC002602 TaxID=3364654 RepID=UPI00369E68A4
MSNTDNRAHEGFTAEERAAMKDHAQELKKAARRGGSKADKAAEAEQDVLAKIAEMQDADRTMAERVHAVITATAPVLAPKLWYGMPSYALDGKVVCYFQSAEKFKARYATLGFSDQARLDDDPMWAAAFALTEVTAEVEARIGALVKQAVS